MLHREFKSTNLNELKEVLVSFTGSTQHIITYRSYY